MQSPPQLYNAFGLKIASVIELPMLPDEFDHADVSIEYGRTPEVLNKVSSEGLTFQANTREFLLCVDNVARFWVQGGSSITIEPLTSPKKSGDYSIFLLGSVIGALLQQRRIIVLHGSAVERNGVAFAFLGISGAGKSTTATSLLKHGFRALTDDICAIKFESNSSAQILPGYPRSKLWLDSLQRLGENSVTLSQIRPEIEKRYLDTTSYFCPTPVTVGRIYLLSKGTEELAIESMSKIEAIETLRRLAFRPRFINSEETRSQQFIANAKMASTIPMRRIERHGKSFALEQFTDALLKDIDS